MYESVSVSFVALTTCKYKLHINHTAMVTHYKNRPYCNDIKHTQIVTLNVILLMSYVHWIYKR